LAKPFCGLWQITNQLNFTKGNDLISIKIQRVNNEIEKTRGKINEFQAKLRELERQKTELENIEIVDAVRGMNISLADLTVFLKKARVTSGQVGPKSATTPKIENDKEEIK